MKRLITLLTLSLSLGCATAGGVTATNPTGDQTQQLRVAAARITDAIETAIEVSVKGSDTLDALQLPQAAKDAFRCAFLKVNGVPAANETVTRVCGAVPLTADTVLRKAVVKLHDVTTCPGLRTTAREVMDAINPFLLKLGESTDSTLRMLAFTIQTVFNYTRQFALAGGPSCSV